MSFLKEDLFSIVCVTYNQENLITECLDSIARQDFRRIELIICDDYSTDRTAQVVEEWLEEHRDRFENAVFLKNAENLGISATHDRGLRCATGKYLKYIAGDDILAENCASQIVSFSREHGITWGQTLVKPFFETIEAAANIDLPHRRFRKYFSYTPSEQFRMFCRRNFFCAPGNFFDRALLEENGFLDTEFRTFEDWHTWLRLTKAGQAARVLPVPLVYWRRHPKSLTFSALDTGNIALFKDQVRCFEKYVLPHKKGLDLITRKHLVCTIAYLKLLIEEGGTLEAHRKARPLKLRDPLWWMEFPSFLLSKLSPSHERV